MDRATYLSELASVLARHTDAAAHRLSSMSAMCPPAATELVIEVFPDQDGEGTFDVWARFDGPDAIALDAPVDAHRHLFGVVHTEDGVEPAVPMWPGHGFCVQDAVVDACAAWLTDLWERVGAGRSPLPWRVDGHDGYGTVTPLEFGQGRSESCRSRRS